MEELCRLCCSTDCVNNNIFDENTAVYLKMTTYLPIKVFKNDNLPQKICDKCKRKVDDFFGFCNEAIEVQNRLQATFTSKQSTENQDIKGLIDLTMHIKEDISIQSPKDHFTEKVFETKSTQTEENYEVQLDDVKNEQKAEPTISVKLEKLADNEEVNFDDFDDTCVPSDGSDDISLKQLKKKRKKNKKERKDDVDKPKKRRKKVKFESEMPNLENLPIVDTIVPTEPEKTIAEVPGVNITPSNGLKIKIKQEFTLAEVGLKPGVLESLMVDNLGTAITIKSEGEFYEEPWFCCVCFMQLPDRTEMIRHYRSHVGGIKVEPNTWMDYLEEGLEDDSIFKCKQCKKEFSKKQSFEKHAQGHDDQRPYRCSLCEKTFRDVSQILKHGKSHTYAEQTTHVTECTIPNCETALKGELCPDDHLVLRPRKVPKPLSKRFVCDLCDEGFVYMRYLIEHRNKTHPEASNRKFVNRCMHCSREFAHLNSLRRHLRSHTGERNFLCNVCGKALSSREHLKFHIRIHTGYKPNICKTCGKGFVKKCNLTLHERVHSGEKPHVCSHCGKAFSQRSTLVIHERYHSGARPYVCSLCGKGFVAKGLLSMHLKTTCI